ncbi:hypothetical protein K2173_009128 [Erythroxylum novogranatense]|uniref:Pre-mRNA-processing protein 40A n=1 Tax=Erythroxylum novogranatense TaxID=1862640 RepID=A0AAV8TDA1_9ROSI|nr:hypothetical protein K2173_009128 [Erythroxylum novogranatense]
MANNPQYSGIQPPQPPLSGSMDPPRNFVPSVPGQFRPAVPPQPLQQFIPMVSPHFQPAGRGVTVMNTGLPNQPQQLPYPQPVQHLPLRPGPPVHGPPPSQVITFPNTQPNSHVISGSAVAPPSIPTPSNFTPGFGGSGAPLSSSYTFTTTSYGQPAISFSSVAQYQPASQMHVPVIPAGGQPGPSSLSQGAPVTPVQNTGEQSSVATAKATSVQPKAAEEPPTDWIEHISANGRRYYYNKRTKQSTWEKPYELMTTIERADASTDWKEYTSPDGRKYYYNRVTKSSKWEIPEELKVAREQIEKATTLELESENLGSPPSASVPPSLDKTPSRADTSTVVHEMPSSPVFIAPVAAVDYQLQSDSESPNIPVVSSSAATNIDDVKTNMSPDDVISASMETIIPAVDSVMAPRNDSNCISTRDIPSSADKVPTQDKEEAEKADEKADKVNSISLDERLVTQEPVSYADKQEAKNAFRSLLESSNVGSDWTWDQAMRVIINDKRYGALRTLGERKQAFNEFLGQKKKLEVEERRIKQKIAREEFRKMLEESTELTSSTRWSKLVTMFENDERFKVIERERERRDLIETYLKELADKERAKAQEERKHNIMEYRKFLESCDFIKATTQWRKVQDRLETDDRCLRLEKIDRLEIFQDYLRDLEKEEEEQRKIQKEELRKLERKNRDEFRKMMEGHVADGTLTANTHWRDYYTKVKDLPAYLDVASNTSGSTPKDLFEDVAEELDKQYHDDKARIKDAVKLRKVSLTSTWTLDDFKAAIADDIRSPPISIVNLKMVFDELLERTKEKEEKEAKKRKRLADDFLSLLQSIKEITTSSEWENCKWLFEGSREFSSMGEESICRKIFDDYINELKELAKESEHKRKEEKVKREKEREDKERRKTKHRREKDREYERVDNGKRDEADTGNTDITEDHVSDDNKNKKHKKRHQNSADDLNESGKDRSRSSHRHSNDHRRSKRHASTPESDDGSKHKKHKRDHRIDSHKDGDNEELEDGEFSEGGEAQ